jgi:hypothetical protein
VQREKRPAVRKKKRIGKVVHDTQENPKEKPEGEEKTPNTTTQLYHSLKKVKKPQTQGQTSTNEPPLNEPLSSKNP